MQPSSRHGGNRSSVVDQIDRPFERGYVGPHLHEDDPGFDRRLLRGERTRLRIAEAMIDLIEGGNQKPTAGEIALGAGVSPRLVFHHFGEVDAIFETAAILQARRHWAAMVTISPEGPVGPRIDAVVRQRRKLFAAIGPVREAVNLRASDDPVIQGFIQAGGARLREELATTFAPELDRAGTEAGMLLDALDVAAGWESWYSLQAYGRKSGTASQRIMRYSLHALLAAPSS